MATPYAKYHKLTKAARNYCSNYEKTSENCGPLRLGENARKHKVSQRKPTFLHLIVTFVATHRILFHHGYNRYAFISFSTTLPS